jgi:hypothetical protein
VIELGFIDQGRDRVFPLPIFEHPQYMIKDDGGKYTVNTVAAINLSPQERGQDRARPIKVIG